MRLVERAFVAPGAWNTFVDNHGRGWWWHREEWIDYSLAYNPTAVAVDRSFAIVSDDHVVQGVFPLVQEGDTFSMGGVGCADPLVLDWRSNGYGYVRDRMSAYGVRRWLRRGHAAPDVVNGFPTFVLPLWRDARLLWSGIRKSYRPLITRAERLYPFRLSQVEFDVPVARGLHERVAGRATRPATWDHWAAWARAGHLLLAFVCETDRPLHATGFAAAILYKQFAYYAASATTVPNTAHALQWHLIDALKGMGVNHYELGWDVRDGDSEKDRQIAFFKSGFGADRWTVPYATEEPCRS